MQDNYKPKPFFTMNTIAEAFEAIDNHREGIPFEAIAFLYNHPQDEEIERKIIFALTHAYDEETYYDEEQDEQLSTPLWYAIVAENHLSKSLIDPVIRLFTTTEEDWDYLNEQGGYLVGALGEKFPDLMPEKVLQAIEEQVAKESNDPYLYLYEAFYFMDAEKYKDRLLRLLADERVYWLSGLLYIFVDNQIKEAIPIMKQIQQRDDLDFITKNELNVLLEELETGKTEHPEPYLPYVKQRDFWKEHYQPIDKYFYSDYVPEETPLQKAARERREKMRLDGTPWIDETDSYQNELRKIGRNEKVSVRYSDGKVVNDIKFKKVEDDLSEGKCELL